MQKEWDFKSPITYLQGFSHGFSQGLSHGLISHGGQSISTPFKHFPSCFVEVHTLQCFTWSTHTSISYKRLAHRGPKTKSPFLSVKV